MFYVVVQSNSGGSFDNDAQHGIAQFLCVEADDAAYANRRAKAIIDGYDPSRSCNCCGPRWVVNIYDFEGSDVPSYCDVPLQQYIARNYKRQHVYGYIHYKDGRIVPVDNQG